MPAPRKTCPKCRRRFTPRRGTRRVNCYECSPERSSAPSAPESAPAAAVQHLDAGEMVAAVRAELERAGQAGTVPGAIALRLARALDDAALGAAQVASISDKLMKVMEPMSKLGEHAPDVLDEFTARLAEKRASA